MEKSLIRERLIEAAILADIPRPSQAPGGFKIRVEKIGIVITYIFATGPGTYSLDHIVSWGTLELAECNPLVVGMTGLLAAARDFKP